MRNYQRELDKLLIGLESRPTLLLHACCAPCASYVLEYLSPYFDITVLFFNPNIYPKEEFVKRKDEAKRLSEYFAAKFISTEWDNEKFEEIAKNHENDPECGDRCTYCYRLRLEKTAELAHENGFDYFATSLTISPLKSAVALNTVAQEAAEKFGTRALLSDFKKKEGYKRSVILSEQFGIYRQNYCGCKYSKGK